MPFSAAFSGGPIEGFFFLFGFLWFGLNFPLLLAAAPLKRGSD